MARWAGTGTGQHRLRGWAWLAVLILGLAACGTPARADDDVAPVHGDISVDQAVKVALARNPDLGSSEENIRASAGARNIARQNYLPRLTAGYTRFHNFNDIPRFDTASGQLVSTANSWSSRYSLTQTIFDVPSLLEIRAAGKDLAASKFNYDFSRSDLVLTVKQQYYALLAAQMLAAVNDSALAVAMRELDRTQSLFELGMVARSDVLKQQVQVATSRLDAINGHADVVNQRARLASDLGQDPSDDLRAADQLGETPVTIDSLQIVHDALNNRPDLRAAHLNWDAAKTRASAARAGFLPSLGASAQLSNVYSNGLVPFRGFAPDTLHYGTPPFTTDPNIITTPTRGFALTLSIPFFDGIFGRIGDIQQARARSAQAGYAYDRARLNLEVEIRSAINSARTANEGIDVAKSGLESAQEDLKLSQEKYNVGSGTILDLLTAQVNLQKAQQQYVLALTQARVAEAQIERARGIVP